MEIVIKIHEKDYQAMKNRQIPSSAFDVIPINVLDVLMKGIPLPKGHGDLIDRSEISIPYDICDGDEAMGYVNEVSAIVEADKCCTYKETGCGSCKRQLDCPIEADKEKADE